MNQAPYETLQIQPNRSKIDQRRRTVTSAASRCHESSLNKKPIIKTISNYFFKPERIPQAIEERNHYKTITAKPFFAKNRKLSEENNRMRKDHLLMAPNHLQNMLRAKSTVIKQKKFQEFYINHEGKGEMQGSKAYLIEIDDCRTNLFRPNFQQKKAKPTRKNQYQLDKYKQFLFDKAITRETVNLPKKDISSFQAIADNLCQLVLREKLSYQNTGQVIQIKKKSGFGSQSVPLQYQRSRQKKSFLDKENLQFELQPWAAQDCDEIAF